MIGLGIDTGGTCTDAVIYDSDKEKVLSTGKTLTTKRRLEEGIANAIGMLDSDALAQVKFVSLSTTLATNACIEGRGARGKLLLIGADRKVLEKVHKEYGFENLDDVYVIDGTPEGGYVDSVPVDWGALADVLDEFEKAEAIGVVQCYPEKNAGAFEHEAKAFFEERFGVPVICGSDLFSDRNVIRRGAGTLLNIRLIPIIRKFLDAVRHVLKDFNLDVPIYVVRSDGSLMKEAFALEHPVETLLCGPAASALGGVWMSEDDDALVIDIGGTTTDIAIIRDGIALTVDDGIKINGWKTFVKGMFIDTFGLGGDSAVRYDGRRLFLESFRVIPVSMICHEYPELAKRLQKQANWVAWFDRYPYEGYVLLRDPDELAAEWGISADDKNTTEVDDALTDQQAWEWKIIDALRNGPLLMDEVAGVGGRYRLEQRLEPLERSETIMRFGLTPTDMMHLLGDYEAFDTESARIACGMLSRLCGVDAAEIPGKVYEVFVRKLAVNIERVLLQRRFPDWHDHMPEDVFDFLKRVMAEREILSGGSKPGAGSQETNAPDAGNLADIGLKSNLPIVGVGGPSHIFMNQAAALLGTYAVLPEHAHVANALGTLAGKIVVREVGEIVYNPFGSPPGFRVFLEEGKYDVEEFDEAVRLIKEYLYRVAGEKAKKRGARGAVTFTEQMEKKEEYVNESLFLFGGKVVVTAYGNII